MTALVYLRKNTDPLIFTNFRNHWVKEGVLTIFTEAAGYYSYAPGVWEILEII
jgi:hypothetical protein